MQITSEDFSIEQAAAITATLLERVRRERPPVHVLTSPVAMPFSANVLLAVGAEPSMTSRPEVVTEFVATSRALVVNLGMLDAERETAIASAVPAAIAQGRPWLLDPVKVEQAGTRRRFALDLLRQRPAVLRANHAEIACLAGAGQEPGALARAFGTVVMATGMVDQVTDGTRCFRIGMGSPLMQRITAMGCALSALTGGFLAVANDNFEAAVAAILAFDVAGEIAAGEAKGPGSFQTGFLDALYRLSRDDLESRAKPR